MGNTMIIWALTHLVVYHPVMTGLAVVLIVIGFLLKILMEDGRK